jgi:uncharacterized membrane protein
MGLIGSLGSSMLQFVFPAAIELQRNYKNSRIPYRILMFIYITLGCAAGGMCFVLLPAVRL